MANYSNLKNIIDQVVRPNGQGDITGANLNQTLQQMVTDLGANYQYAGVATPSTNPGSPDQNVFYIATIAGTYTNFGGLTVPKGISVLRWGGSWSSTTLYTVDTGLTPDSEALVQSGTVFEKFKFDGGPWDVSEHFPTAGPNNDGKFTLDYILTNANTLIPEVWRKGGMSIRFVSSIDNKYVQFRCTADEFTTDTTQWAVADEGVYIENPEFSYVITDKNKRILWAIRKEDNKVFCGAGVPPQIIDYVTQEIARLQLNEVPDIINFLDGLGNTTLKDYLNDNYGKYIENPEYSDVKVDKNGKILEGITSDANKKVYMNTHFYGSVDNDSCRTSSISDVEQRIEIDVFKNKKIFKYRDKEGVLHEEVGIATKDVFIDKEHAQSLQNTLLSWGFAKTLNVPDYWKDAVDECIASVQANNILSGHNGDSFVFVTDNHFPINNNNAVRIAAAVSQRTNNKLIIEGGDLVNENLTKDEYCETLRNLTYELNTMYGNNWRALYGNHDNNPQNEQGDNTQIVSDAEYYSLMFKPFENEVVNPTRQLYYYWDNVNQNIRYVCFNYQQHGEVDGQLSWFNSVVRSAPSGSHLVILIHGMTESADFSPLMPQCVHLADMCNAINIRSTYTIDANTYDFANATCKVSVILAGHLHRDKMTYYGTSQIPIILFKSDMQSTDLKKTTLEQVVTFVDLDYTNGKIYLVRLGNLTDASETVDRNREYNIVV